MSTKHPWMPWYVFDWLEDRSVKSMNRIARSMYFDLLNHEWLGGPLPDDLDEIANLLGELRRSVAPHWPSIRARFVIDSTGKLAHQKLESLRNKARTKSEKAAKSAQDRWDDDANALRVSDANAMQADPDPKQNKKDPEETLVAPPAATLSVQFDFASVYAAYPRKEGQTKGIARLRSQVRTPEAFDQLKRAVANFAEKHRVEGTDPEFIPHFSTWANARWRDYVDGPHIVKRAAANAPRNTLPPSTSVNDETRANRKW